MWMSKVWVLALVLCATAVSVSATEKRARFWVQVKAADKHERSKIADAGVSIEAVRSDSVWGFADDAALASLKQQKLRVLSRQDALLGRTHEEMSDVRRDFPSADARYHNYAEMLAELRALQAKFPALTSLVSIGKSVEGRDLWAFHINSTPESHVTNRSNKPGAIYMGTHHAREHLSTEMPLMLIAHLLNQQADPAIANLLATRDIWVIPMVNPDGVEYDISTGSYKMWRKNRRNNGDGSFGVDLNRNYGFKWGTGGSSTSTSSDTYMGTVPFSEPETQAIRDFVVSQPNAKILLSFHTFSELVLYPWGHSNDPIGNERDRLTFEKMAKTMAGWNGYKPEQSSDLYIASGDTTDWAYGERGIFAFTFELTPKSIFSGGFYPGAGVIDRVFAANLRPVLYLLDLADDPHRALSVRSTGLLKNLVQSEVAPESVWQRYGALLN